MIKEEKLLQQLGERLRAARKSKNLTQEKLAELADISDKYVTYIERAKGFVSIKVLVKLANALNEDLSYFFMEDEKQEGPNNLQKLPAKQRKAVESLIDDLL